MCISHVSKTVKTTTMTTTARIGFPQCELSQEEKINEAKMNRKHRWDRIYTSEDLRPGRRNPENRGIL